MGGLPENVSAASPPQGTIRKNYAAARCAATKYFLPYLDFLPMEQKLPRGHTPLVFDFLDFQKCTFYVISVEFCNTIIMNGFDETVKIPPDGEEINYILDSIIALNPSSKELPNYPLLNYRNSLVVMNDGNVLSLGGRVTKNCFVLTEKSWRYHSTLRKFRNHGVAVTMPNGVYVFGGYNSYDYIYKKEGSFEFHPARNC